MPSRENIEIVSHGLRFLCQATRVLELIGTAGVEEHSLPKDVVCFEMQTLT